MAKHYDTRRDPQGWTVFDRGTGETVVLAGAQQAGMAWLDADDLIQRLDRRPAKGTRSLPL